MRSAAPRGTPRKPAPVLDPQGVDKSLNTAAAADTYAHRIVKGAVVAAARDALRERIDNPLISWRKKCPTTAGPRVEGRDRARWLTAVGYLRTNLSTGVGGCFQGCIRIKDLAQIAALTAEDFRPPEPRLAACPGRAFEAPPA